MAMASKMLGQNLDKTEYTARMAEILITEGVEFELEVLDTYVKTTYPDIFF